MNQSDSPRAITIIEDYITKPLTRVFGTRVDRNLMFRMLGGMYQVRIRDEGSVPSSYALLVRWSREKEDWVTMSIRKPSEWGISAIQKPFNVKIYAPLEDELIDMAERFEEELRDL